MKISFRKYYSPTPASIRKVADAILAASTFLTTSMIITGFAKIAIFALLCGAIAKFLSNIFCEEEKK